MSLILGIDTGGTYTDSVIWDSNKKTILKKAKSFTTIEQLSIGINESIQLLDVEKYNVSSVHISTTLIVNNILENKIAKIGVIVIGKHLKSKIPAFCKYEIMKDIYHTKKNMCKLSPSDIRNIHKTFDGKAKVVVIAVHGERCHEAEKRIALALQKFIDAEIVCGSAYSKKENFDERVLEAVTIIGLKKTMTEWEKSIQQIMNNHKITAPIRILTGLGKLVTFEEARKAPLSMILSGAAASYIGSRYLTNEKNYLLIDIGGTSLDITKVENGSARFAKNTINLGDYKYRINTLDLQSFAIGGDSKIRLNQIGDFVIDYEKVTPLCLLGSDFPELVKELEKYKIKKDCNLLTASAVDCFYINNMEIDENQLSDMHRDIVDFLKKGPHSLLYLADYFRVDADALHIDKLVKEKCVICASLTPTDILHAEGSVNMWDNLISKSAIDEFARLKKSSFSRIIEEIKNIIVKKIIFSCMQSIASFEKKEFLFDESEATMFLIDKFLKSSSGLISSKFSIRKPIVGVGAPAENWLPMVARTLGTNLIIPEDGDVACAIGAAVGEGMLDDDLQ